MIYIETTGDEKVRERYLSLLRIEYLYPDGDGGLSSMDTGFPPLELTIAPDDARVWVSLKEPGTKRNVSLSVTADTAEFIGMMFMKAARITRGEEPWNEPDIEAEI